MGATPPSHEVGLKAQVADLARRLADTEAALEETVADRRANAPPALSDGRLEELGAIAHDLNNAFAAILMAVALLKQEVADEKAKRLLAVLEENAARGAELVRRVPALDPDGGMPVRHARAAGPHGEPAKREPRRRGAPRAE